MWKVPKPRTGAVVGGVLGVGAVGVAALVCAELYLLGRYFDRDRTRGLAVRVGDRGRELGHIVLVAAMIGMAVPVLNPLPPLGWLVVFGIGTGWSGYRSLRALNARIPGGARGFGDPIRELHLVVGYLAMGYVVLVEPMRMPGGAASGSVVPALSPAPVVTVLFAGYFLVDAVRTAYRAVVVRPAGSGAAAMSSSASTSVAVSTPSAVVPGILASPRVLGGCQVVMGLAMVQMLVPSWPLEL